MFSFTRKNKKLEDKSKTPLEVKSQSTRQTFSHILNSGSPFEPIISARKALSYYDMVAPVATAVDMINDEFKTLTLATQDATGSITKEKTSLLEFLKQPNDDMVQVDFLENLGNFFLVTNEVFLVATGRPDREPAEVFVKSPENVDVRIDSFGMIDRFTLREDHKIVEYFYRDDSTYRFYNKDKTAEIWQIKGFSTRRSYRGKSKLSAVRLQVEQFIASARHNLSVIHTGVRASGAFTVEDSLTDEQFDRLRNQIQQNQSGEDNAGKSIILESGMGFKEMSFNPKDMDFGRLTRETEQAVFKRYRIPLALVTTDQMAESTMEISALMLYDNCVIPLSKRLFAEVGKFLGPRFGMADDEKIVPYIDDITALQIRRVKEVKNKKEIGVFTTDEIRAPMGAEPLPNGDGEPLLVPQNLTPIDRLINPPEPVDIGTGQVGQDNRQPEGDEDMESDTYTDDQRMKMTRNNFVTILKAQMDNKGQRLYNDKEIEEIADREGF